MLYTYIPSVSRLCVFVYPTDAGGTSAHKYPSSSHYTRDWDKIERDITEEEKKEKLDGDAAVNQLFQQIYGSGSDEVKKAMNKSFVSWEHSLSLF